MVDFKRTDAADNPLPDPTEIIGQNNLADVLREKGVIRGSFAINGYEFRDFEARSPQAVVSQIDEMRNGTGVRATLDDQFRLVLESRGEIKIASGKAFDEDRQRQAQRDRDRDLNRKPIEEEIEDREDILDLLGLDANDDEHAFGTSPNEWLPGETSEQREERRKLEAADPSKVPPATPWGGRDKSEDLKRAEQQAQTGGGTTTMNQGPSDTVSPDPHNPPGVPTAANPTGSENKQEGLAPPTAPDPKRPPARDIRQQ